MIGVNTPYRKMKEDLTWSEISRKESETKILKVLMEIGSFSFTEIQRKSQMSPNTISIRLKDLIDKKAVEKDDRGDYKITDEGRTERNRLVNELRSIQKLNLNPRIVESIELKNIPLIATSSTPTKDFEKEWKSHLENLYDVHLKFMKLYGIGSSSCNLTAIIPNLSENETQIS